MTSLETEQQARSKDHLPIKFTSFFLYASGSITLTVAFHFYVQFIALKEGSSYRSGLSINYQTINGAQIKRNCPVSSVHFLCKQNKPKSCGKKELLPLRVHSFCQTIYSIVSLQFDLSVVSLQFDQQDKLSTQFEQCILLFVRLSMARQLGMLVKLSTPFWDFARHLAIGSF